MTHFDYSKIDVEDYLHELGLNNIKKKGNQVWFSCPLSGHMGADTTPSASMELETTRMHCFGCNFSGNAVSFLSEYEGVSPLKARKWLRERFNMTFREPTDTFVSEIEKKLELVGKKKERTSGQHSTILDPSEIDKRRINWADVWDAWTGKIEEAYPLAYMLDRGFHPNTLDKWAIGWDLISQRISIPIHDDLGNLVGFKGRSVDSLPKYKPLGGPEYGFDTYKMSKFIFGLDRAKNSIKEKGYMILSEGELNALKMQQFGWENAVGISGKFISEEQEALIRKYCDKIILIFDDQRDTINAARQLEMSVRVLVTPEHDTDPADMYEDQLSELILNAQSSVLL